MLLPLGGHKATVEIQDYEEDHIDAEWSCSQGETFHLYDRVEIGDRPDLKTFWHVGLGPVGSLDLGPVVDLKTSDRKLIIYHNVLTDKLKQMD